MYRLAKNNSEKQKRLKISSKIPEAVKCVSGRPMVSVSSVRYLLPRFTNYQIFRPPPIEAREVDGLPVASKADLLKQGLSSSCDQVG